MVDILLAVYNGEKYITEQLDSIIAQSYLDWRLIIQDDCSNDRTIELVSAYVRRYPNQIELYINEWNSGSPQLNFFSMFGRSTADYVMTCDHDDVWLEDKVQSTLDKMLEIEQEAGKNKPILVHTDLKVVDESLQVISPSMFSSQCFDASKNGLNNMLVQNIVTGCTMMVNRKLVDMVDVLPSDAIMHDWWFGLVASAFGKIGFVPQSTILYRQHASNQVGAKNVKNIGFISKRLQEKAQIRQVIEDTYHQAESFLEQFGVQLSVEQRTLVQCYAGMREYSKFKKLHSLFQYHFFKHSLIRIIGQLIYI